MSLFADRIGLLGTENAFKVGPYIKMVEDQGHRVIKCNLGEPDFPTPKHIVEEIKRCLDLGMTKYCDPQGILPLREAIARTMGERRGLDISPDRVVVFPGAKPPIGFSIEAYCNPGDEVIYRSPCFPIYESFLPYFGVRPVPIQLLEELGFSSTAEMYRTVVNRRTKLVFINSPSNPTGGIDSPSHLAEIAEIVLKQANVYARIYSDEVYEDILFDGADHFSIASVPGMAERTIIVSGVSKTFSWTGGRLGWAVFPSVEEARVFKNLNINYFSCVPPFNQMGAKIALEASQKDECVKEMVAAFQERRDLVVGTLNQISGISCQKPKGAFYVFPNIGGVCEALGVFEAFDGLRPNLQKQTSPATLFQMFLLFRHHVATMDRNSFGRIGAEGKHFLRISIATGIEDLKIAMESIANAVEDRAGFEEFVEKRRYLY